MRKVAVTFGASLLFFLPGCPKSSSGSGEGDAPRAVVDAAASSMVADAAPEGGVAVLLDAGVETTPYVSKEGRFTVAAPTGVTPNATTAGVGWGVRGATLVVSYYDGKPRGVDRTRLYDLARDKIGGSEIEREDDVKVGGFPTRMRRMRLVIPGKPVQWRRSAIVVAGDRTYDISCTSPGQADMSAPLTDKFFESFHIDAAK